MSKLAKIKNAEKLGYLVKIESRNYGRASHFDDYRESDLEKDELTQILSFVVDQEWETASMSETCFMLLRQKIKDLLGDDFKDTKSFRDNLNYLVSEICFLTKDSIVGIEISDENVFYELEVSDEEVKKIFRSWQ